MIVIQSLNILLLSVPYLIRFCQQFYCLVLYCLTCTVSRFFLVNCPTLNLVELFDLILLTRCTHFSTIFLLLGLFLFAVRYLGAVMFFGLSLYSCSSTSFSLASSPLWLSLSMVFWQLFISSIPHFLQHFSFPFKFFHLFSVIPCLKHCTSSSISFLNNSTLVTRLSNFHFFCCLLLGIFFNLNFNRIATSLWSESTSAPG